MAKSQFRTQLLEYVSHELEKDFDALSPPERSKMMTRFYVRKIVQPLNPGLIPDDDEELEACLVDGSGDCGVDFISRDGNTVLIVQAKYSSTKKGRRSSEDGNDFEAFRSVPTYLYNLRRGGRASEALLEAIQDIDWENDEFLLQYITLRQPTRNALTQSEWPIHPVPALPDLLDRSSVDLLTESKLNIALRDAASAEHGTPSSVDLWFPDNGDEGRYWFLNGPRAVLVGRIQASQLAGLFRKHKSALFALNLRNYIGDNQTNKQIKATALDRPNDFFFFNNGISALASNIERVDDKTVKCDDFSIINGAQTVRSLVKAQAQPDGTTKAQQAMVLIRVTQVPKKRTTAKQEFLDQVTKYNNTQTAIKLADFRSNDSIQRDLRVRWNSVKSLSGRKWIYKNKRSSELNKGKTPIRMEEFTKTIYSFLFGPPDMSGGTKHLFDAGRNGGYFKLFGDHESGEICTKLTSERFQFLAGIWFLCEYAKASWKQSKKSEGDELIGALERRWLVYYALGSAMRKVYAAKNENLESALKSLADPGWTDPGDQKNGEKIRRVVDRYLALTYKMMKKAYKTSSKGTGFAHRNWFRSPQTLLDIDAELDFLSDIMSDNWSSYQL